MHQEHSRAPFRVLASRSIVVVSVVVHLASLLFVLRDQDSVAFCVSLGDGLGVQKNASKESLPVTVPMVNTIINEHYQGNDNIFRYSFLQMNVHYVTQG